MFFLEFLIPNSRFPKNAYFLSTLPIFSKRDKKNDRVGIAASSVCGVFSSLRSINSTWREMCKSIDPPFHV